ncbi:restriction endonuclease subunit S [Candidatus Phytoplasma asteris]|uniref:Restriction endonuclease subunit S n=2 Tax=16SrI (Aster yellows group) TaxID=3042590 RepID=A0A859IAP3_9MOLU|nr:MAG: restriction endonuclease subunit S [Rapeseed phyllody phytoplasma]
MNNKYILDTKIKDANNNLATVFIDVQDKETIELPQEPYTLEQLLQNCTTAKNIYIFWKSPKPPKDITLDDRTDLHISDCEKNGDYEVWGGGIKPKGSYNKSNTPENTITITSVGSCGYIHFHTKPFWAAQNLQILKSKDDSFNVLYFYFYLKQKENEIQKNLKQGHIPHFTQKIIKKIKITLPPLETQNEIATF